MGAVGGCVCTKLRCEKSRGREREEQKDTESWSRVSALSYLRP